MAPRTTTLDGNEATARVAYRLSEVVAIYPITPASSMGELSDEWAAGGQPNLWGQVPRVVEMQSEGGAAGAVHGALLGGALTTTFTASQGLLLMLPNLYKVAGELLPGVVHVAARSVATHALSIFGDHSDVMSARATGCAMLCSSSVQEAQDLALVAHGAALRSRLPFLHFFDGFRSSHELSTIELLEDDTLRALVDEDAIRAHRRRRLDPDRPRLRGSAQDPDVFFQARESANRFHDQVPDRVEESMGLLAELTGRRYRPFDYFGDPRAERVVVLMGSGLGAAQEAADELNRRGERVGVVAVRLYRPFSAARLAGVLPATTRSIAVLDRTKEPGAVGEPLLTDVSTALLGEFQSGHLQLAHGLPRIIGGRYGLSSKEFTPAMVAAVFGELALDHPLARFTVGIEDDVTHLSLGVDPAFLAEPEDVYRAVAFGVGSDGTVGASKNTVKIVGEGSELFAQGYFVYDSKKSGSVTVSHLRFSPRPIRATWLLDEADFVGIHHRKLLDRRDVLRLAAPGARVLLNAPWQHRELRSMLPADFQRQLREKQLELWVVDADRIAQEAGLGKKVNTVLQACFFAISGVLPLSEAHGHMREALRRSYGSKGEDVLAKNYAALGLTLQALADLGPVAPDAYDAGAGAPTRGRRADERWPAGTPDELREFLGKLMLGRGDELPVSAFTPDGSFPTGTSKYEKRAIASEIPIWDPGLCIDCAKCALVCPHAAIRMKVYEPALLGPAPDGFRHKDWSGRDFPGHALTIQVAPEDCTGCRLCVEACPARDRGRPGHKALDMEPLAAHLEAERDGFEFFLSLPEVDRTQLQVDSVKGSQLLQPLFEFPGACSGCGEAPYLRLLSQLFGDRAVVANATGCSSIFGGNLPTTPWTTNAEGRGPAWANSLFEDNAEFGLGLRLGIDATGQRAQRLLQGLAGELGDGLAEALLAPAAAGEAGLATRRAQVARLRERLSTMGSAEAAQLHELADALVPRSLWIVGGDGWAYDIGFGGLDHVLSTGADVNILVLDTEVYSNTGGQASKATPRGAVARFAAGGKPSRKKDLGRIAMSYGTAYVAQIALGADNRQAVKALAEAESWTGPSLVLAYSPCIAHGIEMSQGGHQQQKAVASGYWPLYRYDPRDEEAPLRLDSRAPKLRFEEFAAHERRFAALAQRDPEAAERLARLAQEDIDLRRRELEALATGRKAGRDPA